MQHWGGSGETVASIKVGLLLKFIPTLCMHKCDYGNTFKEPAYFELLWTSFNACFGFYLKVLGD